MMHIQLGPKLLDLVAFFVGVMCQRYSIAEEMNFSKIPTPDSRTTAAVYAYFVYTCRILYSSLAPATLAAPWSAVLVCGVV